MTARWVLAFGGAAVFSAAQGAAAQDADGTFGLGQIVVTARPADGIDIGSETLSSEAIYAFNRQTLDEAANLMPGVNAANTGGSRNERLIFVRGFNRFQVPLSIDGIRVFLPADNRLDYGRFLTSDIAEIQIAKGYSSVLNGPDGMGGAINLVTRKPTKELEVELHGTLNLDSDVDYAGYNTSALIGTKQDTWYAQASYARTFVDHWDLPGGFTPTIREDGGARDLSRSRDWRVNGKVGFTPNATDEYSISYTRQEGAKNAPLSVKPADTQRFWTWPYWNIESIYFLSTTQLDDKATLKTRLYRNTFDNLLSAYDNALQNSQTLGRAFNSYYEDEAWGGSAELGVDLTEAFKVTVAGHYRRDKHVEFQQGFPNGVTEPRQTSTEETYSLAGEAVWQASPTVTVRGGASYDWKNLIRAEDYTGGAYVIYPLANTGAYNAQGQVSWRPDDATEVHASISSRARFPTLFERFSSRFGGAVSNPNLSPERAVNYEIGGSRRIGLVRAEAAVFYSDLSKAIVSFPVIFAGQNVSQSRNLGKGEYYGAELSLSATLFDGLNVGGNYTYTHRDLDDPSIAAFRPTDVPKHKAFVYADWSPIERLHLVPSADIASNRWTVNALAPASIPFRYFRTGSYITVGVRADYEIVDGVEIGVGARNLFDDTYRLVDGFPEAGRSVFASVRARY